MESSQDPNPTILSKPIDNRIKDLKITDTLGETKNTSPTGLKSSVATEVTTKPPENPSDSAKDAKSTADSGVVEFDMKFINTCLKNIKDSSKVFISLDIEQYERNLSKVTEIGVSMYYPLKTESTDSLNTNTSYLFPDIRAVHFIIKENHKFRNGKFVEDNRFRFAYGKSAYFSQKECIALLGEIFGKNDDAQNINVPQPSIVFVGHNVKGDISYLKKFGVKFPEKYEVMDTLNIWRHTRPRGPAKLESLLKIFGIPFQFLHNAGKSCASTCSLLRA